MNVLDRCYPDAMPVAEVGVEAKDAYTERESHRLVHKALVGKLRKAVEGREAWMIRSPEYS